MNLTELSLIDAQLGLAQRRFSCLEYVDALLDESARQTALNCFIEQDEDRLRDSARVFDANPCEGPLAGVPLALKDNIDVCGVPSSAGNAALRALRPATDAPVAARLFQAGALLAGKANMHELALGITSNNGSFGACRNPYDTSRSPGGSSGGCGAALAARLVPGALGTDTGGSVRLPAALCGVVGFRPSSGRYSQQGIVPISHTRDTAGPMARSVADVALLDQVIVGAAPLPPASSLPLAGLRLGILQAANWEPLEAGVQAVCSEALNALTRAGVEVLEVSLDGLQTLNAAIGFPVALYELLEDLPAYLRRGGHAVTLSMVAAAIGSPDVADIVHGVLREPVKKQAYQDALAARLLLQQAYRKCFESYRIDALVFPTAPLTAPLIGDDETVEFQGKRVPIFNAFIRNTDPASNAGIPGISLPAGLAPNGLPVGLELDGPVHSDRRLLSIAAAIEQVLPRPVRPPRPSTI